ncbi:MAG: DM13 domain-containing protein [Candidatus Nitrosotenuis sp.]
MLRTVTLSVIIGTFLIGMYYVVAATYVQPAQQDRLSAALMAYQEGLTYDKLVSLDEATRYDLIQKMPSATTLMIIQEARNHPSFIAESKDEIKEISGSNDLRMVKLTPIAGLKGFSAKGTAAIFVSDQMTFLRLEDFGVTSGIDQHLYLTKDGSISTGIDLGRLKASQGSQNYDITGVDTETYDILIIYSKPFDTYYTHARFLKAQ